MSDARAVAGLPTVVLHRDAVEQFVDDDGADGECDEDESADGGTAEVVGVDRHSEVELSGDSGVETTEYEQRDDESGRSEAGPLDGGLSGDGEGFEGRV